jgi:enamine deaminase RidA (YjgF/YER057c/UK114 family)
MLVSSVFSTAAVALATVGSALAAPAHLAVTHIGTKGALYTSAVATKDMIFVSGAIPWANGVNGTIPTGIEAQTVGIPIFFYANTY